jgi:hypothetical protein
MHGTANHNEGRNYLLSNELLILSVNFCNVVKRGIRDNPKNNRNFEWKILT